MATGAEFGREAPSEKASTVNWTKEEDVLLKELTCRFGTNKWSFISSMIPNKSNRHCRRRWQSFNSTKGRGHWTPEEDLLLYQGFKIYGHRWTEIAKMIPGRTDNATKNRFSSILRQLVTFKKRKWSSCEMKSSPILKKFAEALSQPMNGNSRLMQIRDNIPLPDLNGISCDAKQIKTETVEFNILNGSRVVAKGDQAKMVDDDGEVLTPQIVDAISVEQSREWLESGKRPCRLIDLNSLPHSFDLNFPPPEGLDAD